MTITVEIHPDVNAELIRQARAHGVDIDTYVAALLQEAASLSPNSPPTSEEVRQQELERTFQELGQFSHKVPRLPDSAFTRESLYRDHD